MLSIAGASGDANASGDLDLLANLTLAASVGPTPVMLLRPGSPAIDAGSCTDINGNPITLDQRGLSRPQGFGCDMGAVEDVIWRASLPWISKN